MRTVRMIELDKGTFGEVACVKLTCAGCCNSFPWPLDDVQPRPVYYCPFCGVAVDDTAMTAEETGALRRRVKADMLDRN